MITHITRQQPTRDTEHYCLSCGHHGSFHVFITRDKWKDFPDLIEPGAIPWFCEHTTEHAITGDKKICGCMDFVPGQSPAR